MKISDGRPNRRGGYALRRCEHFDKNGRLPFVSVCVTNPSAVATPAVAQAVEVTPQAQVQPMCYLISVAVVSPAIDVRAHFHGFDLVATDTVNPTVKEALGPDLAVDITEHGCSCSLRAHGSGHDEAELRRRYAKKGWTAAKIDRAIESVSRSRAHSPRTARDRFLEALAAMCRSATSVRLVSHAYTGRFDQETFELSPPRRIALDALSRAGFVDDAILICSCGQSASCGSGSRSTAGVATPDWRPPGYTPKLS